MLSLAVNFGNCIVCDALFGVCSIVVHCCLGFFKAKVGVVQLRVGLRFVICWAV